MEDKTWTSMQIEAIAGGGYVVTESWSRENFAGPSYIFACSTIKELVEFIHVSLLNPKAAMKELMEMPIHEVAPHLSEDDTFTPIDPDYMPGTA